MTVETYAFSVLAEILSVLCTYSPVFSPSCHFSIHYLALYGVRPTIVLRFSGKLPHTTSSELKFYNDLITYYSVPVVF